MLSNYHKRNNLLAPRTASKPQTETHKKHFVVDRGASSMQQMLGIILLFQRQPHINAQSCYAKVSFEPRSASPISILLSMLCSQMAVSINAGLLLCYSWAYKMSSAPSISKPAMFSSRSPLHDGSVSQTTSPRSRPSSPLLLALAQLAFQNSKSHAG